MGEVYRATDTKLKRDVAIKVLPAEFTEDKERLQRFEREAQLLAQLHHPNIASIFGLEESGGTKALVMELVEGPTLAERLENGSLPLDDALLLARQIAEALEEAHEKGIIHRDLKPQNIKASIEGKVKVLDFGLAKALDPAGTASGSGAGSASQLAQSPTLTFGATQIGMILGTAAYMSPEQAAGKPVDRRADIWAFGVVLWEMLTGRRLFEGESVPETLGAVFRQEISFDALPADLPPALRRLVERCLVRDPRQRLRDIGEARIALSGPLEPGPSRDEASPAEAAPAPGSGLMRALPWMIAGLTMVVAFVLIGRAGKSGGGAAAAPDRPLAAIGVGLPPGNVLAGDEAPVVDVARDGSLVVFEADGASGRRLFLRRLDRVEATPVEGTEGAVEPFLSPDNRWIGFFAGSHLRKVLLGGGAPVEIASVNAYRGATWADGGWIVYTESYSSGLVKVREGGGAPEKLTELDRDRHERTHRWPSAVVGTPWILFTVGVSQSPSFYDDSRIDAVNLETGQRKTVYDGAWMARFAPPRTLLLQRRGSLFALDFDPATATASGPERPLLEGVGGEASSGAGFFAAGAGGVLAYVPSDAISSEKEVTLVEPDGRESVLDLPRKSYWYPRFSPDGRTLAFDIGSGQGSDDDIWLYRIASRDLSRLTFTPPSGTPAWSPDGRWVAYGGKRGDRGSLVLRKRADGVGSEEEIWQGHDVMILNTWFPDGSALAISDVPTGTDIKLFRVPLDGSGAQPIAAASGGQWGADLSPDGRFITYTSTETGIGEVFVSSWPEGHGKWQVSVDSGEEPAWSPDGKRIYYVKDGAIWVADVETGGGGFRGSAPRRLLAGPYVLRTAPIRNYDVGPGGRLVLVRRRTDAAAPHELEVLVGWQAKLGAARPR